MNRALILPALICGLMLIVLPATLFGATLVSLTTCKQVNEEMVSIDVSDCFNVDLPVIHAVAVFSHIEAGTVITGKWIAVDAAAISNYTIDATRLRIEKAGDAKSHFSISKPEKGWPPGNYRFELLIGKNIISAANFSIVADSEGKSALNKPYARRKSGHAQPISDRGASKSKMASNQSEELLGCWQCQTPDGLAALVFHSEKFLSYGTESSHYTLVPGAIRVSDGVQQADYHYQMKDNQMEVQFPDGTHIYCERWDCSMLITQEFKPDEHSPNDGYSSGPDAEMESNEFVAPYYDSGSWETEGDRQYYDESAGYGGGAYENPNSNYYEYNNE